MTGYLQLAVVLLLAVNPAAAFLAFVPRGDEPSLTERPPAAATGLALAAVLYATAASTARPLLDFLDVEPETFRVAAGVVMAVMGARTLLPPLPAMGDASRDWRAGIYPLGIPLIAGPAGLMAAISYGADEGTAFTLAAAAPALLLASAVAGLAPVRIRPVFAIAAPLMAALLVAAGAGLIVSGVRDI